MIGRIVGNYRIVALLGRGGMGEVWRAEHVSRPGIRAAIKTLLPEISAMRPLVERFFNEANAVSLIKHASIVRIFDLGYLDDRAYLVMELLEGLSMSQCLEQYGPVPIPHALEYGRQVASAVYAAHAAGIIHRDLKPDNLFLIEDHELASGKRVKVLDFGIAKLADTRTISGHTVGMMGTPAYMPPEQWQDAGTVDTRSDIYALGCLLYEMLCGRTPFPGRTMPEFCTQHLTWPPPSPRAVVQSLPPDIDRLIVAMMAKDRAQRPQSMLDVDRALETIQERRGLRVAVDKRWLAADASTPQLPQMPQFQATPPGPPVAPMPAQPMAVAPTPAQPAPMPGQVTTFSHASGQVSGGSRATLGIAIGIGVAVLAVAGIAFAVLAGGGSDGSSEKHAAAAGIPSHDHPAGNHASDHVVDRGSADAPASPTGGTASGVVARSAEPVNRWIRVDAAPSVVLGISEAQAKAGELGFAAARHVGAPDRAFEIQQHEVTWGELASAPIAGVAHHDAKMPATGVAWEDARDYCRAIGGDLPTEAQWELAARGAELRPNPWGDAAVDPGQLGVFRGPGGTIDHVMSHPLDRTPGDDASAIFDLAGNAQEWTADEWTEDDSATPPAWAKKAGRHHIAIRGLPVLAPPPARLPTMSATYRDALCASGSCPAGTDEARAAVGFRCVRDSH